MQKLNEPNKPMASSCSSSARQLESVCLWTCEGPDEEVAPQSLSHEQVLAVAGGPTIFNDGG